MEVKFLGHGCLEISVNNKNIVLDPFISGNPKNKFKSRGKELQLLEIGEVIKV
jgi:L-ascorbate metabolism protein UlaG (beta-lactamase superfamily)